MSIDQMPAGREMDVLIAEKVMGWTGKKIVFYWDDRKKQQKPTIIFEKGGESVGDFSTFIDEEGNKIQYGKPHRVFHAPHYSTDIAGAWKVVEAMTGKQCGDADDFYVFKIIKRYQQWSAYIHHPLWSGRYNELSPIYEMHEAYAETAPLAICRASLKAMGVKI